MDYRFQFRDKIRIGLIGDEGAEKQQLIELLKHHPMFVLGDSANNHLTIHHGPHILLKTGTGGTETCILPEINGSLAKTLPREGVVLSHPSSMTSAVAMALKPLDKAFTLTRAHVITALPIEDSSMPSLDALDNVSVVEGHLSKEIEPLLKHRVSSHTLQVPVCSGMLQLVSVSLLIKPTFEEMIACWTAFQSDAAALQLHSSLSQPLRYCREEGQPQPRMCSDQVIQVGGLRTSALFDYDFVVVSNPRFYGPVAGAIRNAELLVQAGLVFW